MHLGKHYIQVSNIIEVDIYTITNISTFIIDITNTWPNIGCTFRPFKDCHETKNTIYELLWSKNRLNSEIVICMKV